jgi:hypothetical protein
LKRIVLLALATGIYVTVAWMVAPGFYDGFTPPNPYAFTSPPPQAAPGNVQPKGGHLDIKVVGGVSDALTAYTTDGCPSNCSPQVVIGFNFGVFDATGKTSISVDITPVSSYAPAPGLHFVTNVYLITATAPLIKPANLELRYSNLVPAPSFVYRTTDAKGPWKSIGGQDEPQIFSIQSTTDQLGYFAAGYPANATTSGSRSASSQLIPIAVALLIVAVLVAGIPIAVIRGRRAGGEDDEDGDDAEA